MSRLALIASNLSKYRSCIHPRRTSPFRYVLCVTHEDRHLILWIVKPSRTRLGNANVLPLGPRILAFSNRRPRLTPLSMPSHQNSAPLYPCTAPFSTTFLRLIINTDALEFTFSELEEAASFIEASLPSYVDETARLSALEALHLLDR